MESAAKITVAYFFSIQRQSIPFASLELWLSTVCVAESSPGFHFPSLLGTGTGKTFTPSDAVLTRNGAWSLSSIRERLASLR